MALLVLISLWRHFWWWREIQLHWVTHTEVEKKSDVSHRNLLRTWAESVV